MEAFEAMSRTGAWTGTCGRRPGCPAAPAGRQRLLLSAEGREGPPPRQKHRVSPAPPPRPLRGSPRWEEGAGGWTSGWAGWERGRGCGGSRPKWQPPAKGSRDAASHPAPCRARRELGTPPPGLPRTDSSQEATFLVCPHAAGSPTRLGKTSDFAAAIPALSVPCVISFQGRRWIDRETGKPTQLTGGSPLPGSPSTPSPPFAFFYFYFLF